MCHIMKKVIPKLLYCWMSVHIITIHWFPWSCSLNTFLRYNQVRSALWVLLTHKTVSGEHRKTNKCTLCVSILSVNTPLSDLLHISHHRFALVKKTNIVSGDSGNNSSKISCEKWDGSRLSCIEFCRTFSKGIKYLFVLLWAVGHMRSP